MDARPPLVVATATTKEMHAVLHGLGVPAAGDATPEQGGAAAVRLGGRDCLLLVTGVGPVNAALALGRLLGHMQAGAPGLAGPRGVVNLGVAGSFDLTAAPLGAAVAADLEIWPEYGLLTAAGVDPKGITLAQGRTAAGPVWDRLPLDPEDAARAMGLRLPPGLARGPGVTVAGVSGTAARAGQLRAAYAPLTESMEGFALAFACATAGAPFLEVRTVSNRVGSRASEDWALETALRALGQAANEVFAD